MAILKWLEHYLRNLSPIWNKKEQWNLMSMLLKEPVHFGLQQV